MFSWVFFFFCDVGVFDITFSSYFIKFIWLVFFNFFEKWFFSHARSTTTTNLFIHCTLILSFLFNRISLLSHFIFLRALAFFAFFLVFSFFIRFSSLIKLHCFVCFHFCFFCNVVSICSKNRFKPTNPIMPQNALVGYVADGGINLYIQFTQKKSACSLLEWITNKRFLRLHKLRTKKQTQQIRQWPVLELNAQSIHYFRFCVGWNHFLFVWRWLFFDFIFCSGFSAEKYVKLLAIRMIWTLLTLSGNRRT